MAVDAPSDSRTPEGNPHSTGNESNLNVNGNTNGSTVNGNNKRGKVEKRFFMGDQGVNMWREGMEVGSLMRDGISQYQFKFTFSFYLHLYIYVYGDAFVLLPGFDWTWEKGVVV
jgi:hypothetical protein